MIKAVATDKDGTLFRSNNTIDEDYFDRVYQKMRDQDIPFIVASGNQLARLQSYFPNYADEMTFVAENGAVVYDRGELVTAHYFPENIVESILKLLHDDLNIKDIVLCGLNCAYILDDRGEDFDDYVSTYYYYIEKVSDLFKVEDNKIVKIAIRFHDEAMCQKVMDQVETQYEDVLRPVTSGNDSMDLILNEVNKGHALEELLEQWEMSPEDILAFGDADNDVEMLALTPHSYAMADCSSRVAEVAQHRAPSNDESGVLQVIEQYIK